MHTGNPPTESTDFFAAWEQGAGTHYRREFAGRDDLRCAMPPVGGGRQTGTQIPPPRGKAHPESKAVVRFIDTGERVLIL